MSLRAMALLYPAVAAALVASPALTRGVVAPTGARIAPLAPVPLARFANLERSSLRMQEAAAAEPPAGGFMEGFKKFSGTFCNFFPVWTASVAGLGLMAPGVFAGISTSYFTVLLGMLMLSMGITLTLDDFKRVLARPYAPLSTCAHRTPPFAPQPPAGAHVMTNHSEATTHTHVRMLRLAGLAAPTRVRPAQSCLGAAHASSQHHHGHRLRRVLRPHAGSRHRRLQVLRSLWCARHHQRVSRRHSPATRTAARAQRASRLVRALPALHAPPSRAPVTIDFHASRASSSPAV